MPKRDHIPNIQKRLNPFLSNCALEFRISAFIAQK